MRFSTIKKIFSMFCVNHIFVGTRCFEIKRRLLRGIGYDIGEGTKVVGPVFCTGKLIVGRDCWLGRDLTVNGNGAVIIGDRCDLAPSVMFLTGTHEIGDGTRRAGRGENYTITVGNGTWIGGRATVTNAVKIGNGCVIAACACVVSDIDDNRLVGGIPAKVIRELVDESN